MKKLVIVMILFSSVLQHYAADELTFEGDDGAYFLPAGLLDDPEEQKMTEQERAARKAAKKFRRDQERFYQKSESLSMNREDILSAVYRDEYIPTRLATAVQPVEIASGEKSTGDDEQDDRVMFDDKQDNEVKGLSPQERQRLKNQKKRERAKTKKAADRERETQEDGLLEEMRYEQSGNLAVSRFDEFFNDTLTVESCSSKMMLKYLEEENQIHHDRGDAVERYKRIVKKYDTLYAKKRVEIVKTKTIVREQLESLYGVTDKKQQEVVTDAVRLLSLAQIDCDSRGNAHREIVLDLYFWNIFLKRSRAVVQASMQDPSGFLQQDLFGFFDPTSYEFVYNFGGVLQSYRGSSLILSMLRTLLSDLIAAQKRLLESGVLADTTYAQESYGYMKDMLQLLPRR